MCAWRISLKCFQIKLDLYALTRSCVYMCVGCLGSPDDYDTMVRLYRDTDLHEEKERFVR